jgi:D-glycero-D-manno-heptose 1,7-bisphosphate phosphatase
MRRAVFLDRDGVINHNRPDHVKSLDEFVLLPGVLQALALLGKSDLCVVVVSNQSAINRGLVTQSVVESIHQWLLETVQQAGGRIDAIAYCPHRPDEACRCRKPQPGLLLDTAQRLNIDLRRSFLVGDALSDVQAAVAAGVQPVLVLTGRGKAQVKLLSEPDKQRVPVFEHLLAAVEWILGCNALSCCRTDVTGKGRIQAPH